MAWILSCQQPPVWSLLSTYGHTCDELVNPLVCLPDIWVHGLVQTVIAAVWDCNLSSSEHYLLLRLPLSAAIKMASLIVQLAQDHVVLEEKLVSHAKSAEGNKKKYGSRSRFLLELKWIMRSLRIISGIFSEHIHRYDNQKLILHDCCLINSLRYTQSC